MFFHPGVGPRIPVTGLLPVSLLPASHCEEEIVETRTPTVQLHGSLQGMNRSLVISSAKVGDAECIPVGPSTGFQTNCLLSQLDRTRALVGFRSGERQQRPSRI